jgi:3-ketosteroid 9alpha-monooxygenase subunit B
MTTNQTPSSPPNTNDPRRHYHQLRVAEVIRETHDAASVVFEIPDALSEAFAYQAGQFLTLEVPYQGKKLFRCYSLASSPVADQEHKVTIKRVADGRISNWINDELKPGDIVTALPPAGEFVLGTETLPIVAFSGGSGITPCISIIKTALATTTRNIRLLYANRDQQSVIFHDELQRLQEQHPQRLEVQHRLDVEHGFVDAQSVRSFVGSDLAASFYLCGPGPFMDVVENELRQVGAANEHIHVERFSSPSDGEQLASTDLGDSADTAKAIVHLDGAKHEIEVAAGESILAASKRAGIEPPFSCESGFCGCCMAKLKSGEVEMATNDFLSPEEVSEGWVLTCQGRLKGRSCEVEYPY